MPDSAAAVSCVRHPRVASPRTRLLSEGWEAASSPAGLATTPQDLLSLDASEAPDWISARVPGTAAGALQRAGIWHLEQAADRDFDGEDWWFRCRFSHEPDDLVGQTLCLDGIATSSEIWLNGIRLGEGRSMFQRHEFAVSEALRADNELYIRIAALSPILKSLRGRPRWRAPMVSEQKLRFVRTTLLGRTPGWSPPAPPVGPWRPVRLESRGNFVPTRLDLSTQCPSTDSAQLSVEVELPVAAGLGLEATHLLLEDAQGRRQSKLCALELTTDKLRISTTLEVDTPQLWWPHTHGEQPHYDARLELKIAAGPGRPTTTTEHIQLGSVGFRHVELETEAGEFAIRINGERIFCRGACWTPVDALEPYTHADALRPALSQLRDAGMNMLRVTGTMVYEDRQFYSLCDELGMMVWQDFMFANMEFPQDADFVQRVDAEAVQELRQWQAHPCVTLVCGNSEAEQQAAMWGAARETWSQELFDRRLREHTQNLLEGVPYWPSSASGGAFPHQPAQGSCSYYGVGAYLRGLDDLERAGLRFASECLAFANIPETRSLEQWGRGLAPKVHSPQWKSRSPRDMGAGWDFDDVRDHYVQRWFQIDPAQLRYHDHDRYLQLGRIAVGELMRAAIEQWRRPTSSCRGALVLFARDLWPGAGWGMIDAYGRAKSVWYYFRRAAQPRAVALFDDGLNGASIVLHNETAKPWACRLRLEGFSSEGAVLDDATCSVELPAHATREIPVTQLLGSFVDTTFAYRFGPNHRALWVASALEADDSLTSQSFYQPGGPATNPGTQLNLELTGQLVAPGHIRLRVAATRHTPAVALDTGDFLPSDNYFDIKPGGSREIDLLGPPDSVLRCTATPAHAPSPTRIVIRP